MDNTTAAPVALGILALAFIAFFAVFRSKGKGSFGIGLEVERAIRPDALLKRFPTWVTDPENLDLLILVLEIQGGGQDERAIAENLIRAPGELAMDLDAISHRRDCSGYMAWNLRSSLGS